MISISMYGVQNKNVLYFVLYSCGATKKEKCKLYVHKFCMFIYTISAISHFFQTFLNGQI